MVEAWALELAINGLFTLGFALFAYALAVLDGKGAVLAFALGLLVAEAAGLRWMFVLVFFTLVGYVVTKLGYATKLQRGVAEPKGGRRGWKNVFANGVPPTLLALLVPLLPNDEVALAFLTAIAAAASDKFASELGVLSPQRVHLITSWSEVVPRGTNGGVTVFGTSMSLVGALLVGVAGVWALRLPWGLAVVPTFVGFLGCQLDSVLGALYERVDGGRVARLTKNDVNFISIGFPGLLVLAVALLL